MAKRSKSLEQIEGIRVFRNDPEELMENYVMNDMQDEPITSPLFIFCQELLKAIVKVETATGGQRLHCPQYSIETLAHYTMLARCVDTTDSIMAPLAQSCANMMAIQEWG